MTLNTISIQQDEVRRQKRLEFKAKSKELKEFKKNHQEDIAAVREAMNRFQAIETISDESDLARLYARAEELGVKITFSVNGEQARLEVQRSECLKAIGQLKLSKFKTI